MLLLHTTPSAGTADGPTWALHTINCATVASFSKRNIRHCCTSKDQQTWQLASEIIISSASITFFTVAGCQDGLLQIKEHGCLTVI